MPRHKQTPPFTSTITKTAQRYKTTVPIPVAESVNQEWLVRKENNQLIWMKKEEKEKTTGDD